MLIRFLVDAPSLKIKKGDIVERGESAARHYVAKGVAELVKTREKKESWTPKEETTKDLRKGRKKKK